MPAATGTGRALPKPHDPGGDASVQRCHQPVFFDSSAFVLTAPGRPQSTSTAYSWINTQSPGDHPELVNLDDPGPTAPTPTMDSVDEGLVFLEAVAPACASWLSATPQSRTREAFSWCRTMLIHDPRQVRDADTHCIDRGGSVASSSGEGPETDVTSEDTSAQPRPRHHRPRGCQKHILILSEASKHRDSFNHASPQVVHAVQA